MEVFCRDITELDLQQLREYMSKDSKLFDIPPLGEHYARQWATGDLESEQEAALSGTTEGIREGGCSVTAAPPPPPSVCLPHLCASFRSAVSQAGRATHEAVLRPAGSPHAASRSGMPAPTVHSLASLGDT